MTDLKSNNHRTGTGQAGYDTPGLNEKIKVIGSSPPLDTIPKKINRYSPDGLIGENDDKIAEEDMKLLINSPKDRSDTKTTP